VSALQALLVGSKRRLGRLALQGFQSSQLCRALLPLAPHLGELFVCLWWLEAEDNSALEAMRKAGVRVRCRVYA
jgi:hypothetical protein